MSRGGRRPGAGRPRRDAPPVFRLGVRLDPEIGELVRQYAERKGIPVQEGAARLMSWGARLASVHLTRRNQTEIKRGPARDEDVSS